MIVPMIGGSLARTMDSYEIALNYVDGQHQGDRRKRSQQCFLIPKIVSVFTPKTNLIILMMICISICIHKEYICIYFSKIMYLDMRIFSKNATANPRREAWQVSLGLTLPSLSRRAKHSWARSAALKEAGSKTFKIQMQTRL